MAVKKEAIRSMKLEDWYSIGYRLLDKVCQEAQCEPGEHCKQCYVGKMFEDVQMCYDLGWINYLPSKVLSLRNRFKELVEIGKKEAARHARKVGDVPVHLHELREASSSLAES